MIDAFLAGRWYLVLLAFALGLTLGVAVGEVAR